MIPHIPAGSYLFDTNVVSATRQGREEPFVLRFVASIPLEKQFLSVLTLGELWRGFTLKDRQSPHGAISLSRWIDTVEIDFADRVLPVDRDIARTWGEIAPDRSRSVIDTLLAATAIMYDMTLVTRNVVHFQNLPVRFLNPWNE